MIRAISAALVMAMVPNLATTAPAPAEDPQKREIAKFAGTWEVVSLVVEGEETIEKGDEKRLLTFKRDGRFFWGDDEDAETRIAGIDPTKEPQEIDYAHKLGDKEVIEKAIYKIEKDTFTDCFAKPGAKQRPTEFKSTKVNGWTVVVYKRVKKVL